jgi:leucyl/phenylalanyl-tRNA--protein transferase
MWHAPDPRFVIVPSQLRVNRTLLKVLRRHPFDVRLDTAFADVIQACATAPRDGQLGTWITPELARAYVDLHRRGHAHSAEAWRDGQLVGGLYGVALGKGFFGESMFAAADDASKVAFTTLVRQLQRWGFWFVDCQVETPLLASFGAQFLPRKTFTDLVRRATSEPAVPPPWQLDEDLRHGASG